MRKKSKSQSVLGRSLIKDRFGNSKSKKFVGDKSMLHTTEIQDGYDWGRLNLQSVTEESSFQEFLTTAELAGTEFTAQKLNVKFVNQKLNVATEEVEEKENVEELRKKYKDLIKVPRRPAWSKNMDVEELERNERESFLEWRRSLASLQNIDGILLTPFEKNLEYWRQLWRVIEKSDVIAQIVDARNPLLFRCEDLELYVKEVSEDKLNLIIINKADFLSTEQRQHWADYFEKVNVKIVFFSAIELPKLEILKEENANSMLEQPSDDTAMKLKESIRQLEKALESSVTQLDKLTVKVEQISSSESNFVINSNKILSREALIEFFKIFHRGNKVTQDLTTVGLVGYPNVGKSSTINSLLSLKKVSVSSTPGKTKHFQTLFLDNDLLLCDCPGLVMPSFVHTKAEMIINGILPIDQMRDHVPPINLISSLIPRHALEDKYGFILPLPSEDDDPNKATFSEELLNAYGYNRGFMTSNGQPDNPRAARYILKDFVNGKLLYVNAPPGIDQNIYHTWPNRIRILNANRVLPPQQIRAVKSIRVTSEDVDRSFFATQSYGAHVQGKSSPYLSPSCFTDASVNLEKPWKKENKHKNKNKREKLRKLYVHLDKH